jgi:hypothetical protein
MTLLSERVKKAKQLRFTSKKKGQFSTWGSKDDHYIIDLSSSDKQIVTPDGYLKIPVFYTKCHKHIYSNDLKSDNCTRCQGNIAHTVCYHSMGAICHSFETIGKSVSFHNTYRDADRALSLGGFLAKIENQNGRGFIWAVVRDKTNKKNGLPIFDETPETQIQILDSQTNINLMRGSEDDEGID